MIVHPGSEGGGNHQPDFVSQANRRDAVAIDPQQLSQPSIANSAPSSAASSGSTFHASASFVRTQVASERFMWWLVPNSGQLAVRPARQRAAIISATIALTVTLSGGHLYATRRSRAQSWRSATGYRTRRSKRQNFGPRPSCRQRRKRRCRNREDARCWPSRSRTPWPCWVDYRRHQWRATISSSKPSVISDQTHECHQAHDAGELIADRDGPRIWL